MHEGEKKGRKEVTKRTNKDNKMEVFIIVHVLLSFLYRITELLGNV